MRFKVGYRLKIRSPRQCRLRCRHTPNPKRRKALMHNHELGPWNEDKDFKPQAGR
jgi:hypothetical protein